MSPQPAQAGTLAGWLLALADSKRLLGIRYGEWCTGAPELEADIAATAMAQYELGHARILFGLLSDFDHDPREAERGRSPAGYRHLPNLDQPFAGWTDFVVANALVDTALTVALESALASSWKPLAQRLRKAVEEEAFHFLHGQAWLVRLAGQRASRAGLAGRLERAWPPVLAWFGPQGSGLSTLARAGLLGQGPEAMRRSLAERLEPALRRAGLPGPPGQVVWDGWSQETRRAGPVALDRETFRLLARTEATEVEG